MRGGGDRTGTIPFRVEEQPWGSTKREGGGGSAQTAGPSSLGKKIEKVQKKQFWSFGQKSTMGLAALRSERKRAAKEPTVHKTKRWWSKPDGVEKKAT